MKFNNTGGQQLTLTVDDHNFWNIYSPSTSVPETIVRIGFNRGLTWAERETFRKAVESLRGYIEHQWEQVTKGKKPMYVSLTFSHDTDSRKLVNDISNIVEWKFLNIHPVSAKTIDPETYV